ncbi:hypothetical protein D8T48_21260 [Vibrio vulnificus]|nr:hypothetical protein D8T48_21260 [Vibrio vulnificus]
MLASLVAYTSKVTMVKIIVIKRRFSNLSTTLKVKALKFLCRSIKMEET